ncbi:MAG TPA: hypothetical protein VMU77_00355, partial [Acidimicrobiales bacterium]|nr:hypothetical protein [Acidimicrobiales bacterium]
MDLNSVGVVFGGPSPEHDVSVLTGLAALRELAASGGHGRVTGIYWSTLSEFFEVAADLEAGAFSGGVPNSAAPLRLVAQSGGGFIAKGSLGREKRIDLDAVINCCHGGPGEDGTLAAVLDLAGISYAGPGVAGSAIGMDKLAFGCLVDSAGMPVLDRKLLTVSSEIEFGGPYIVKPRFGGSSIGIDTVSDLTTAKARLSANQHLKAGAVIEPYRPDLFDLNIAMRTWPELSLSAIERPIRRTANAEILDYRDKYVGGEGMVTAPRELPAKIDPGLGKQIVDAATLISELCKVRGVARLDFLSDGDEIFVNELNTIPGSLSKHLWVEPDVKFGVLLSDLLAEAVQRPAAIYTSAGADGTVLSTAGSIASK